MTLAELRKSKGFRTQKDFAAALNMKSATIGKWESGASSPKTKDLPKVLDVLSCTVSDFFNCLKETENNK